MRDLINQRDRGAEKEFLSRLCVIGSFPRSGSHWTRRMLAEIISLRTGIPATFGHSLNKLAGFTQMVNAGNWKDHKEPIIWAAHDLRIAPAHWKIYLRRDFEEVFRSTQKAEMELPDCWWGGSSDECFRKWKHHNEVGCSRAKLVVDYNMIRANPETTIRAICEVLDMNPTDEEIARALFAGRRDNMLKEQDEAGHVTWSMVNTEDACENC